MLPSPPRVTSGPSPESPSRELSEWAVPREPLPELSECPRPESPAPRDLPGTRRPRHVSPGAPFSSPSLENVQKIDRTLEMHHKSIFDPKNAIPIIMALYCSVLPRKKTKPTEKIKLPLKKSCEYTLFLIVSGRFLWPKLMKFYQ